VRVRASVLYLAILQQQQNATKGRMQIFCSNHPGVENKMSVHKRTKFEKNNRKIKPKLQQTSSRRGNLT